MIKKIVFKVSPFRKIFKKKQEPIVRSKYAQHLFEIGAGWNERKTD